MLPLLLYSVLVVSIRTMDSQQQQARRRPVSGSCRMEVFEGNPLGKWAWENIWYLPMFKRGEPGQSPCTFGDAANIFRTNIEQASFPYFIMVIVGAAPSPQLKDTIY